MQTSSRSDIFSNPKKYKEVKKLQHNNNFFHSIYVKFIVLYKRCKNPMKIGKSLQVFEHKFLL